jgi:hypothetical protein
MVTITHMEWTGTDWSIHANVVIGTNSWSSGHVIPLPETASEDDLKAFLLDLYGG